MGQRTHEIWFQYLWVLECTAVPLIWKCLSSSKLLPSNWLHL
jgi:hypothetical protein